MDHLANKYKVDCLIFIEETDCSGVSILLKSNSLPVIETKTIILVTDLSYIYGVKYGLRGATQPLLVRSNAETTR